ncbi:MULTISPECIES: hypothetical protein [Halorussus]|uniref:hypothetical protein n=1 Tax=Halorussus TaxID=1070314 RepID=UPI000E213A65|nr:MULTISPECIES: hypothetical protein [Halorussus]NHN59715.1 hypothetical protein [Halorussus sp. JP-T4]
MTERGTQYAEVASGPERSRAATALFVVGLVAVVANSALYFFGVESVSHPTVSVLALGLLVPLYLKER